jgi:hypothetical protein
VAIDGQVYKDALREPSTSTARSMSARRSPACDDGFTQYRHITLDGPIVSEQDGPSELLPSHHSGEAMMGSPKFKTVIGFAPSTSPSASSSTHVLDRDPAGIRSPPARYFCELASAITSEYRPRRCCDIRRRPEAYPHLRPGSVPQPGGTSDIAGKGDSFAVTYGTMRSDTAVQDTER